VIGNTVGSYRIVQELGTGAMGTVYEAVDTLVGRLVAIKALRAELAKQPDLVDRFRSEAMTLARFNHPNIALLYNFFQQDGDYYMAMEFVRGRSLESLIRDSHGLEPGLAARLMSQALDGVAHAHRMGVLHRDIKPANILVTGDGLVKVTDFGIARVLSSSRTTCHGRIIGTLEYMAPERIRGDEADLRSDLYSAGVVLYEMLTGQLPFTAQTDFELLKAHLEQEPPALREVSGHMLPEEWNALIQRAMAKAPEKRFQSAEDFRREVETLATHGATGALLPLAVRTPSNCEDVSKESELANVFSTDRRPTMGLLLVAAAVLVGLAVAVALRLHSMHEVARKSRAGGSTSSALVGKSPPAVPQNQSQKRAQDQSPSLDQPSAGEAPHNGNETGGAGAIRRQRKEIPDLRKVSPQLGPAGEKARQAALCVLYNDSSPSCKALLEERQKALKALEHQ
jgi:serine/threonine-protein kinase